MNNCGLLVSVAVMVSIFFTASCVTRGVPVTETYYETEYETEYKTETYTETEDVVVSTSEGETFLSPTSEWQAGIYLQASGSGVSMTYYYGYGIGGNEHTRSEVKIKISSAGTKGYMGAWDLTGVGQIPPIPLHLGGRISTASGELSLYGDEQAWFDNLNAILTDSKRTLIFEPLDVSRGSEVSFDADGIKTFAILNNSLNKRAVQSVKLVWSDDVIEQRTVTKERQVPYQVPVQMEKQRTVTVIKKVPIWEAMGPEETLSTTPEVLPASQEPSTSPSVPAEESTETSPIVLYEDDYSDRGSGLIEQSTDQGESYYKDGEFHGVLNMRDWSSWQYRRNAGRFGDFIMEEDIRLVSGPENSNYGLIFRCQDDDNFYRFLVSPNGNYVIGARLDGKWVDMPRWMMSEYIEKGYNTNHLKVVCKGNQIEVYVNGHFLTSVVDDSFADGYIGGMIGTNEPGAHVAFDNLKVYSTE
jgi:hypothetical protein